MSNNFELLQNINQKGGNTGLNIVIFLVILLIFSAIGYYVYISMHKYKPPPLPPIPPSPSPPEEDNSGNWEMNPGNCIRGY